MEGELLGVSATDALELGIDIGELDCAISVGFPGTVASLRQQWGRAGRRGHGLAILVASEDGLDQFFMREPEALVGRRVEATRLDHANPRILDPHVYAAAYEGPVRPADAETLGPEALERAAVLPELEQTPAGYVWKGRDAPAARFSLRSGGQDSFTIVDATTGSVLGLVERERAYSTVHEGAVYLHLGEQYLVRALDGVTRTAVVEPAAVDWYTQVKKDTNTAIELTLRRARVAGVELEFGRVSVTEQVIAYQRKAIRDGSTLDVVPLILPEVTFDTEAVWFCPDDGLLEGLEEMPKLLGALHAAEHALISLLPLWAMCDRWDIGGLSTNLHFQTGRPTVFVYDGHAGGVGITERGFESFAGWVADTARLLAGCPCTSGCPSCVQSPKCGNLNEMLDKEAALLLLERMACRLSRCATLSISASPVRRQGEGVQQRRRRQRGVLGTRVRRSHELGADDRGGAVRRDGGLHGGGRGGDRRGGARVGRGPRPDDRRHERARAERRGARHGRALRRGEGVARRLLPVLVRHDRGRDRPRGEDPLRVARRRGRGAARPRRRGGSGMRYAMLVYGDHSAWEALSEEEAARQRAESMPRWIALFEEMGKTDPDVLGRELANGSEGKVVRVVDGQTVVTDGPFAETKEQLGGIFVTELPDLDEAIRLAALVPSAEHGTLEIRPLGEM